MRPRWVMPRLAPSPITLQLDLAARDANGVVGAIADGFIALVRGANISADAAEEQKIDRRLEDGLHQLLWRHGLGDTEQLARFRAEPDLLRCARVNAAAFGNQALVVVLPARPRQREHPLALGKACLRIGIWVDEDIAVVECGEQSDRILAQHAVAEHIARHVADTDHVERRLADIDIHFAEMPLHRLPGAARGNAHGLVVVAGRTARGECIAEPVVVLDRDRIGDIGERRGALVGCNHEVRIVAFMTHHVRGRNELAVRAEIVGNVEQRRDEKSCTWRRPRPARRRATRPSASAWARSRLWRRPAR